MVAGQEKRGRGEGERESASGPADRSSQVSDADDGLLRIGTVTALVKVPSFPELGAHVQVPILQTRGPASRLEVEILDGRVELELGKLPKALIAALGPVGLLAIEEQRESVLEAEFADALGVTMSALVDEGQPGLTGDEESHFLEYRSLSEDARQELRRYAAYLRHRAREAETLTS